MLYIHTQFVSEEALRWAPRTNNTTDRQLIHERTVVAEPKELSLESFQGWMMMMMIMRRFRFVVNVKYKIYKVTPPVVVVPRFYVHNHRSELHSREQQQVQTTNSPPTRRCHCHGCC